MREFLAWLDEKMQKSMPRWRWKSKMTEMEHKLKVLSNIAKVFNDNQIKWAVGASLLLYFKGITDNFHDIDVMVAEEDAVRMKELLLEVGTLESTGDNAQYKTKHFYEFVVDEVEIDVMGGFIIVKDGKAYNCSYTEDSVVEHMQVNGQTVPLQSIPLWRRYYELMGRDTKVAIIDANREE